MSLFLLKGRERTSAFLAAVLCFALIVATAGEPHRTIVDGREVVEGVLYGHVVSKGLFLLIFAPTFGGLWFGIHRLLNRLWPERNLLEDPVARDRREATDDPVPKGTGTAMAYLQESEPEQISSVFNSTDWLEESRAFQRRKALWLATATDAMMNELVPAAREMRDEMDDEVVSRLANAHEERGIPSLDALTFLAEEIDSEPLRGYVRERAEEQGLTMIAVDKVYERPAGGFIAWSGDDPQADSPLDYVPPTLRTALDYLQAEEPAPVRVLILGLQGAQAEEEAFHAEIARWLGEATDETLHELIAAARTFKPGAEDDLYFRLAEAHEERGIPNLDALEAFAKESGNESIHKYVAEKRAE